MTAMGKQLPMASQTTKADWPRLTKRQKVRLN